MKGKIGRDSYGLASYGDISKESHRLRPKAAKQNAASLCKADTHSQALSLFCSFALEGNFLFQLVMSIGS